MCHDMTNAFANINPVNPPNKKHAKNVLNKQKVQSLKFISLNASDHAKILTAVGIPITKVAHEKKIYSCNV